jgi:hypothetical protein
MCQNPFRSSRVRLRAFALTLVAFHCAGAASGMDHITPHRRPSVLAAFPMQYEDSVLLPVSISGRSWPFLLDTGASTSAATAHFEELFQRPAGTINQIGFLRTRTVRTYHVNGFTIGRFETGSLEIHKCEESASFDQRVDEFVKGVIGVDALSRRVLQLDFDEREVRILDSHVKDPDEQEHSVWFANGGPYVMCDVGVPVEVLIDTGSGLGFTLTAASAERLRKVHWRSQPLNLGASERKTLLPEFLVARELTLGEQVLVDQGGAVGGVGTIGMGVLSRYRVTLDFPNKKLYLKPRKRLPARVDPEASGLRFRRTDKGTFVDDLYLKGIAYESGMRSGDRVISLDGKPIGEFVLGALHKRLTRAGDKVVFVVERSVRAKEGGSPTIEPMTFAFTLRWPVAWPPVWPEKPVVKKPIPID